VLQRVKLRLLIMNLGGTAPEPRQRDAVAVTMLIGVRVVPIQMYSGILRHRPNMAQLPF